MNTTLTFVLVFLLVDASYAEVPRQDDETDNLPENPQKLIQSFVVFVDGIRSPKENIYADENEYNKKWSIERNQLTEGGKALMERVGRSLQTRYKSNIIYNTGFIKATSNGRPTAKASVDSVLHGIYEVPDGFKWRIKDIKIEELYIESWTRFRGNSDLFETNQEDTTCKQYTLLRDKIIQGEMKKLSTEQKSAIKEVIDQSTKSEVAVKPIETLDDVFDLWDNFQMMKLNKKELPKWVVPLMPKIEKLVHHRLFTRVYPHLQYYTGQLLYEILNYMAKQYNDWKDSYDANENGGNLFGSVPQNDVIHLHGSDDVTVTAMVWALTKDTEYMASPGDTLIFEVSVPKMNIELFLYSPLNPEHRSKFKELKLKKFCNELPCNVDDVISKLRSNGLYLNQEEWEKMCQGNFLDKTKSKLCGVLGF
ncbi:uncharacterized protein LOC128996657 [Macrosteles quadrilineatus]|uniref:uncharacterized protein LOC128996657 n=1 Tax=Macrosteles quadrilineatus TaxID=74068 RepID=UPI0023E31CD1|nr:uncharacterized protein LOC128996657 [Macrosteles quadrilineatus]